MEGSYWLRFAAIMALLLGSIYVLLPSLLAEPPKAPEVAASAPREEPSLELWFEAADASLDPAAAAAVKARLDAMEIPIEHVEEEGERLTVYMRAGTRKEQVAAALAERGQVALYGPEALGGVDPEAIRTAPDRIKALSETVGGRKVAEGATALPATIKQVRRAADGTLVATVDGSPGGADPVLVAVDGRVVGALGSAGVVGGAPGELPVELIGPELMRAADGGLLVSGVLPESLKRFKNQVVKPVEAAEEAVVAQTWWEGLLPDTRMNLGLDLQGGIDLTLQVDQDEAVMAQVQRDRDALRAQALRDNLVLEVTRERARPALRIRYDGEFSKLKEYVGQHMSAYNYVDSNNDDKGQWHVFELNDDRVRGIMASAVQQVVETLRKRVDSTGVKEPSIVQMGGGRINIQLPGVTDAQSAIDAIGTQAVLEFRLVDAEAGEDAADRLVAEATAALGEEQAAEADLVNDWLHEQGKLPNDRIILWHYEEQPDGTTLKGAPVQLKDQVILTGGDVNNAGVGWDQSNQPYVHLEFKPQGASVFCQVTTENVRKPFAIILDGQVRSAPNIKEPICGGSASIEMGQAADGTKSANTLALVLRTGSLTAPVDVGEVRQIGPSLGADAVRSGVLGALAGGVIIVLFMGIWYRTAGLVADIALVLNVLLVFALLALFGATLTLPGIAGVALTIGMAVDANIIVYERIREELAIGVSARKAVDTGYDLGITAVIDANLTTAIAGIVLYSYGTGPIKGFAVTLLIGIFTTITTGIFVTRTLLEMVTRNSNTRLSI